jgi:hypothetical protein
MQPNRDNPADELIERIVIEYNPRTEQLKLDFTNSDYFRVLAHIEVAKQICLQSIMRAKPDHTNEG